MSLTAFAVKNRAVSYVLLVSVLAFGLFSIFGLPRREDPDLQGRFVQIIALFPGSDALQTEQLLADPMERSLMELDDIKNVYSTSRPGVVVLQAEAADRARDMKKFRDELRNRIDDLRPNLPSGVASVEVNDRFADTSALILGVSGSGASQRDLGIWARRVRDRVRRFFDVSQVDLVGDQDERIWIDLSTQRMARLSVSPSQVVASIAQRNVMPESGGSVVAGATRLTIQPSGEIRDWRDMADIMVASVAGSPVYLRDIAALKRGYADPPSAQMRVNGAPAVGIAVTMRKGFNISALGDEMRASIPSIMRSLPPSARVTLVNDLPRSVAGRIGEFNENLLSGVALIVVVLYLFMGLRSAAIVGIMLPVTILGTFALMYLFGRDIQQISIAALIISLGLVVDNSIVVVDNIERKLSEGMEPERAAIEGVDQLRVPLLTSNLTTVASFAPILLLSGSVGEFIRDLGVVTSLATLISLLFNYTIAPLLAIKYLKGKLQDPPNALRRWFLGGVDRLRDVLSGLAIRALARPGLTTLAASAALLIALAVMPTLGTQFFPSAVRNQFTVDISLPEGRDIAATLAVAKRVEAIVREQRGVETFATYVGEGSPRFYYNVIPEALAPNYAQIVVNTSSAEATRPMIERIQRAADRTITEARVTVRALEQGPPVGAPIQIQINGDRIADLRSVGTKIKEILNRTPGASSVYQNFDEPPLQLRVSVDEDRAKLVGLSSADVAEGAQMAFSGMTASYLRENDKQIPIELRMNLSERTGPQSLGDLNLPTGQGESVPIRQVAQLSLEAREGRIVRRNHRRMMTVYAYTDGLRLPSQVLADAQRSFAGVAIPDGVRLTYGGEDEEVGRSFAELLLVLFLTFALNLVIVVWEFGSMRIGLTILAAVPFSMTGAVAGLYVMHLPFGFMAFLGMIGLSGIVTNHAIVLFEYAMQEQRRGLSLDRALLEAGRRRLRPILLTVLLSMFGLLPQAVNGGTLWPPLAWSQIFGLVMSLMLTLVVVPSVYKTFARERAL
jgi:multidrug efflux pump subunit AcrB